MPYDESRGPSRDADRPSGAARDDARPDRRDSDTDERRRPPRDEQPDRGDDREQDHDDGHDPGDGQGKRRRPWLWVVLALVVLLAIIGGVWYWLASKDEATTDDAYTDGRAITVAPQVSGQVVDLAVNDNQFVHAGDLLVQIDPRPFIASRDQAQGSLSAAQGQLDAAQAALALARVTFPAKLTAARAQVAAAQAVLSRAQADLRRQQAVARPATTQQDIDQATAAQRQAAAQLGEAEANLRQAEPVDQNIAQVAAQAEQWQGQVAQAQAQLASAQLNLGYARVTAPQDGWVTKRNVERGNYASAGGAIMSLVAPDVWVTANFKENQLERMRPGQHVTVRVDAYPGLTLRGHVDSLQLGTGSKFTAFPAENATGNFVKIVQRLPVKIVIDSGLAPDLPLALGLSVDPTVDLK